MDDSCGKTFGLCKLLLIWIWCMCATHRFPGVTWSKRHGKWEAYSHEPPGGSHGKWPCQKTSFGFFDNEEEAAKEADRGRVKQVRSFSLNRLYCMPLAYV